MGITISLSFLRMDNEPLPIDWPTVWRDAGENKHAEWVYAVLSYKNSWVPGSAGYCQLCVANLEPRLDRQGAGFKPAPTVCE